MIARSAGGRRMAACSAEKPPQLIPNMPTVPALQGWVASQSMTARLSRISRSVYSSSAMPRLLPLPRTSRRQLTYPAAAKAPWSGQSRDRVQSSFRYGIDSSTAGNGPPPGASGRYRVAARSMPSSIGIRTCSVRTGWPVARPSTV